MSKIERFFNTIEIILLVIFIVIPLIIFILFFDLIIFCINKVLEIIYKNSTHNINYISDRLFIDDYYWLAGEVITLLLFLLF